MVPFIKLALILIGAACIMLGFDTAIRALRGETDEEVDTLYNVGRQHVRVTRQKALVRSSMLFLGALLCVLAFSYISREPVISAETPDSTQQLSAPTATAQPPTATPPADPEPTEMPTEAPSAAATLPPPPTIEFVSDEADESDAPAPTPAPTRTPVFDGEPREGRVVSEAGLMLRDEPNGSNVLRILEDGETLLYIDGLEAAGGYEWQKIRLSNGIEGWVAAPFIQPIEP